MASLYERSMHEELFSLLSNYLYAGHRIKTAEHRIVVTPKHPIGGNFYIFPRLTSVMNDISSTTIRGPPKRRDMPILLGNGHIAWSCGSSYWLLKSWLGFYEPFKDLLFSYQQDHLEIIIKF